jgi:hypothetical protein
MCNVATFPSHCCGRSRLVCYTSVHIIRTLRSCENFQVSTTHSTAEVNVLSIYYFGSLPVTSFEHRNEDFRLNSCRLFSCCKNVPSYKFCIIRSDVIYR